jgi:hypothetical protein
MRTGAEPEMRHPGSQYFVLISGLGTGRYSKYKCMEKINILAGNIFNSHLRIFV